MFFVLNSLGLGKDNNRYSPQILLKLEKGKKQN